MDALKKHPAFVNYIKQQYVGHPVGALFLAKALFEGCSNSEDGVFWDIMATQGERWNSQSFLDAAKMVIEYAKAEGNEE